MPKFIDKILAGMGNLRAMERLHVDDHTESIINEIEGEPFAISAKDVMYAGPSELGGYYFLQTVIVGAFNTKTIKGAQLILEGNDFKIELKSDMVELESDFSNVSKRFITKIDFQIEKEELEQIIKSKVKTVILKSKKSKVEFITVDKKPSSEEE